MICNIEEALDEAGMRSGYAVLASYSEGDVVKVGDSTGVVTALMKENFKFPTGEDSEEDIEASSDEPVYVVALESGNAVAVSEDELSDGSFDGEDVDPGKLAEDGEEAAIYREMSDPDSMEELLNIRGVDDPEVGFASLPNGWDRSSVLKAWASLGGTWTSCRREMVGDISSPKRFCSALKDEVLMTEMWRGKF